MWWTAGQNRSPQYGTMDAKAGACAVKSLQAASKALQQGTIDLLVTAPIHKAAIQSEAVNFPGIPTFWRRNLMAKH